MIKTYVGLAGGEFGFGWVKFLVDLCNALGSTIQLGSDIISSVGCLGVFAFKLKQLVLEGNQLVIICGKVLQKRLLSMLVLADDILETLNLLLLVMELI